MMSRTPAQTRSVIFHEDPDTWYDSEEHITALSLKYPGTIFSLDCEGEDASRHIIFFRDSRHLLKEYRPRSSMRTSSEPGPGRPRCPPPGEPLRRPRPHPYGRMLMSHLMADTPEELERARTALRLPRSALHNAASPASTWT